jgi:hypothetical protein
MITSCWKTLKTVENLEEKPDLTLGTCLNLANSFLGFDQIFKSLQKNILLKTFLGAIWHQFTRKRRLDLITISNQGP